MSRAERRREDRSNSKLSKWLMGLNREQKLLLTEYCIEQSKQDLVGYFNAYERVLRPNLVELTSDEIETEEILKKIIYEVRLEGLNLHEFNNGSVEYMNKLEESRPNIISKYNEMKNAGVTEKDILSELKISFAKFTPNAIKNIVIEYKRDLKKEQIKADDTDSAVEYIFEEEQKLRFIDVKDVVEELGTVEAEFKKPSKLEILRKTVILDVKGTYGTYHVENGIIDVNNERFINSTAIKARSKEKREELQKQIEEINNYESELLEVLQSCEV